LGGRVSLALVLHNHQPVGNFGWVIQDVYEQAYLPMLDALDRHPGIRVGLHYTGPLLSWFADNRPEALHRIRGLVDRGQAEIVGGGYYEPILAALPDRDRQGQLIRMRDELEHLFGERPRGAWLAERVWEPSLAGDLAAAGYEWTVLDDNHLRAASVPEDAMWTAFTTDDRGRRLTVFGTEQGLRYRIPFKPVEDLISYLRSRVTEDGHFVGVMGDDGEKFGAWPGTFEYCWSNEHWVDRCFEAIEASSEWLATVTPSEWLETMPPTQRAYFPTSSYVEMTEWVLPPDETPVFTRLLEDARLRGLPAARFLRGGFWRNYMARYREVNELHKQMLRASDKVEAMPRAGARGPTGESHAVGQEQKARALDHLYQGQSNDCYWHGLFGGIYIVHMRMATLANLIAAEDLAALAMGDPLAFLGSLAYLDPARTRTDLAGALRGARQGYPRVIPWGLQDLGRVVGLPPEHWLLVTDPAPFAVALTGRPGGPIHLRSIPAGEGHMAAVPPALLADLQRPRELEIKLERFKEAGTQAPGRIRLLAATPVFRPQAKEGLCLLTNGRGGMARVHADLGAISSKYDCLLAANLHPDAPCDRHVLATRLRAWANADGFITALDRNNLVHFEPGPPGRWIFVVPAGDGRMVQVDLAMDLLQGRNTVVARFLRHSGHPGADPELDADRSVSLVVRLDLEARSYHAEPHANDGADRAEDAERHAGAHPRYPYAERLRGLRFPLLSRPKAHD